MSAEPVMSAEAGMMSEAGMTEGGMSAEGGMTGAPGDVSLVCEIWCDFSPPPVAEAKVQPS